MNKCGIKNCVVSDNRHLWKCEGSCNRFFHGACVGVARNKEEILRTFMLPLCTDCQEQFTCHLDLNILVKQQQELTENIKAQIESNHALIGKFKSMNVMHEALDGIETSLIDLKDDIKNIYATTCNSTTKIINRVSSVLDGLGNDLLLADLQKANNEMKKHLQEHFEKAFAILELKIDTMESSTSSTSNCSVAAKEILDELKVLSAETSKLNAGRSKINNRHPPEPTVNQLSLSEELACSFQPTTSAVVETCDHASTSGWRLIGSKKIWKRDWTEFDARQRTRRLQEKQAEKATRRRRQQQRRQNINSLRDNIDGISNNTRNVNKINIETVETSRIQLARTTTLPLDKELLAAARLQFSGPPKDGIPSFINFQKGETINPYKPVKTTSDSQNTASSPSNATKNVENEKNISSIINTPSPHDSQFELDPMRPPLVRLTQQSSNGDGRFLKARLRDPKIMKIVRLFLAYMKDQQPSVCVEGLTPTSIRMLLASEGLPTSPEHLKRIFSEVYHEYGISQADADADLQSYRSFLVSERTHRLQQLRESTNKFVNFRK